AMQTSSQSVERLALHLIDNVLDVYDNAVNAAARLDTDRLADGEALVLAVGLRRPVVHPALDLVNFRRQRAAERHVELLYAAADRQKRHATLQRRTNQGQGGGVAGAVVGTVLRRRL